MSPKEKQSEQACEIIEVAIDEIELLTRAFETISEVCEDREEPHIALDEDIYSVTIH